MCLLLVLRFFGRVLSTTTGNRVFISKMAIPGSWVADIKSITLLASSPAYRLLKWNLFSGALSSVG